MKQYRITSGDFIPEGETGEPDAFMDASDLSRLKQLAGLNPLLEMSHRIPADAEEPFSPVGAIPTDNSQKRQIERNLNIKTGTPEWFRLWFAKPELTGEKPVGDEKPESEPNPNYLLDKQGLPDSDKVAKLADKLDKKQQSRD